MSQRFEIFLDTITIKKGDYIVDLGGGTGSFMTLFGEKRNDYKILVADISQDSLETAKKNGFDTLLLNESGSLPFKDQEIDVIFCNSVIEHYTVPKSSVWSITDGKEFKKKAFHSQAFFASEIERVSQAYFVQTPSISFPIESHTFFPFTAYLSRPAQLKLIKVLNKYWVKKTAPDWNLLNKSDLQKLFPNGRILDIKWLGFSKEIIAYKNHDGNGIPAPNER